LSSGVLPSTVNRELTDLRSSLNKAVEWGLLDESPMKKIKLTKVDEKGKVRFLTPDEETRLCDAINHREQTHREKRDSANKWRAELGLALMPVLDNSTYKDRLAPIVLIALNTGLRRGELFDLAWDNVAVTYYRAVS
jgi:integrase